MNLNLERVNENIIVQRGDEKVKKILEIDLFLGWDKEGERLVKMCLAIDGYCFKASSLQNGPLISPFGFEYYSK